MAANLQVVSYDFVGLVPPSNKGKAEMENQADCLGLFDMFTLRNHADKLGPYFAHHISN